MNRAGVAPGHGDARSDFAGAPGDGTTVGAGTVPVDGDRTLRRPTPLTWTCAGLTPLLYVIWVAHFAVDSLFGDDWNMVPGIDAALHGRFRPGDVWAQYQETRVPVVHLVFLAFAEADRLDTRAVIVLNALVFAASYAVVLAFCHRYLPRGLTPLPVLLVGVTWFSLADVETAFWAFQIGWYLVVFCYLGAMGSLLLPVRSNRVWLAVAVSLAVVGSLSFVQGFIVWPLAAAAIAWTWSTRPDSARRMVVWWIAGVATLAVYLVGFDTSQTGCVRYFGCVAGVAYRHPAAALRYFVLMLGNVVPGGYLAPIGSLVRFEVLGSVLLLAALWILGRTWFDRAGTDALPVPALLIAFGLAFDAFIVVGRTGTGPAEAVDANRYLLANLIVLTGIVVYVVARLPYPRDLRRGSRGTAAWRVVAPWVVVLLLVGTQVDVATRFGLVEARGESAIASRTAWVAVDQDLLPADLRQCVDIANLVAPEWVAATARDRLAEFAPNQAWKYNRLGPPPVPTRCTHPSTAPP